MTTFTYLEPLRDGHCTFWARMVLKAAVNDPRVDRVRLVTNGELVQRLEGDLDGVDVEIMPEDEIVTMTTGSLMSRGRAQWRRAREEARRGVVFLPFFDHAVVAAAIDPRPLPPGGRVNGVVFRPPNAFGLAVTPLRRLDAFRRWTTYALACRTTRVPLLTLDELAPDSPGGQWTNALQFLPDPAPKLDLLEELPPRTDGREVVLVFGALTERKGIFQALDAWTLLTPTRRDQLVLRFVGRLGSEERGKFISLLNTVRLKTGSLIELEDRFVDDEELAREVRAASIILAPYQNHIGSSGVLHWAVAARRPLIAQNTGLIGFQVNQHGLGLTVDCTSPEAIALSLAKAQMYRGGQAECFSTVHCANNFTEIILSTFF